MVLNKKIAIIALCCALLVSASACGNNGQATLESVEAESVEVESVVLVEEETEHETEVEPELINYVEVGFVEASTATKKDLTGSTGKWEFKGLPLLPDDCEWIDTSWNKDGSVEYGALYRKVAMLLEGFDIGVNNGSAYADLVFGVDFTSKADLEPYVENASTFIVEEDSFQAVMHKLEECETVTGDFDYTYGGFGKYSVDISDACECAKELQISDEMFGYVLASLLEKAAEISFDGMSCHIEYIAYIPSLNKNDYMLELPNGSEPFDALEQMYIDYGDDAYTYYYYMAGIDESREGVLKTNRGIVLGDSVETVVGAYGEEEKQLVDWDSNDLYNGLAYYDLETAGIMKGQCTSVVSYAVADVGCIDFYFDSSDALSWLVFYIN